MSPLDLAFLVGPLVAPIIGILVMVALVVARPTKWALWIGSPLFGLTATAWLTYWFLWGRAFDRVDAELDPIASSEVAMNAAIWACAAGCIALVVTAVSAFVSTRRPRAYVHILRHGRPCATQLIRNEAGRRGGLVEDPSPRSSAARGT